MANVIKECDISQIKYTPVDGEVVKDSQSGKYYIWQNNEWNRVTINGGDINMTQYDLSKSVVSQLPELDPSTKISLINEYIDETENVFYMLYGKEINYFTILFLNERSYLEAEDPGEVVIECLSNIGKIRAIELDEDNNVLEMWVMNGDQPTCVYMYGYDDGMVEIAV